MKRIFLLSSLLLLLSCTNVSEEADLQMNVKSERTCAKDILQRINTENPYSRIGMIHNRLVASFLIESSAKTRSGISPSILIKQKAADIVDSMLVDDGITYYCRQDYELEYNVQDTGFYEIRINTSDDITYQSYLSI